MNFTTIIIVISGWTLCTYFACFRYPSIYQRYGVVTIMKNWEAWQFLRKWLWKVVCSHSKHLKHLLIPTQIKWRIFYSTSKQPGKPEVSFTVSEAVEADIGDGVSIPRKHKVLVQGVQSQCLCVFSEAATGTHHNQNGKQLYVILKETCVPRAKSPKELRYNQLQAKPIWI